MKKFIMMLFLTFGFSNMHAATAVASSCVITVNVSGTVYSNQLTWNGCGKVNQVGLQSAFDEQQNHSTIDVVLNGDGRIIIPTNTPLNVKSNTRFYSNGSDRDKIKISPEYGAVRPSGKHLITVYNAQNVTLWNLFISANETNYGAIGSLISIVDSDAVKITANVIRAHNKAIAIRNGHDFDIKFNSIHHTALTTSQASLDSSGFSIWANGTDDILIDQNAFSQLSYYSLPGQPRGESGNPADQVAIDMIAVYSTTNAVISKNFMKHAHTAAIYAACGYVGPNIHEPTCSSGNNVDLVIWDNKIKYTKQHGIDLLHVENIDIIGNKICDVSYSMINLAHVVGGQVRYAIGSRGGIGAGATNRFGDASIQLLWGTENVNIFNNTFFSYHGGSAIHSRNAETVGVQQLSFPAAANNSFSNNYFMEGSEGLVEQLGNTSYTFTGNSVAPYNSSHTTTSCNF